MMGSAQITEQGGKSKDGPVTGHPPPLFGGGVYPFPLGVQTLKKKLNRIEGQGGGKWHPVWKRHPLHLQETPHIRPKKFWIDTIVTAAWAVKVLFARREGLYRTNCGVAGRDQAPGKHQGNGKCSGKASGQNEGRTISPFLLILSPPPHPWHTKSRGKCGVCVMDSPWQRQEGR